MKIAYFDCFSGVSGNMIVGALIDAGLKKDFLIKELKKIPLSGYKIKIKKINKSGLAATSFILKTTGPQPHRILTDIKKIISGSRLEKKVKEKIIEIFITLGQAESRAHQIPLKAVYFHEIGAVDTIIDIAAAVIGFKKLGFEKVYCSALNLGSGTIQTEHGRLPVPAPATAEIIKGIPAYGSAEKKELTTPTGAAIIKTFAENFGPMPEMFLEKIGTGAGSRQLSRWPNILRLFIGEVPASGKEEIILVECNLDDVTGQIYETIFEKAFRMGALDVFLTPIQMKKNRPAVKLSLLIKKTNLEKFARLIFEETPAFGLRWWPVERIKLERKFKTVKTPFGKIKFKIGCYLGRPFSITPEYENLKKIAKQRNLPFRKVLEIAQNFRGRWLRQ